jgi:putative membrane protein
MKLLAKLLGALIANAVAILIAGASIPGVTFSRDLKEFTTVIILLTLANLIVRPIAKIILSPLILITLGFFTIIINAGILYLVDFYANEITISGLTALLLTTFLVSFVNIIFRFFTKKF